jgi:ABC-type amino acid transport substrate-binding protein
MTALDNESPPHNSSLRGQLYWVAPIVIATLAVTLLLLLNPKWGGDVAAIIVIPINVAAVLIPVLIRYGVRGVDPSTSNPSRARKLRVAIAFTTAALLVSGSIYWFTRESDPRDYLSGTVKIGVSVEDYPGFNAAESGKRQGFNVALIDHLAEYFGFEVEYVTLTRKERIDRLDQDRDDAVKLVVASFSITPERDELIDFAGPYFIDTQGFFTWNNVSKLEDIPPGKVCTPNETTAYKRLTELGWQPDPAPSLAMCVERLLNQKDPTLAVSTDSSILQAYAARKGISPPAPIELGLEKYGIGIPNNRPKLCKELNKAIEEFLLYKWDRAFQDHLPELSPGNRRPVSLPECKTPSFFG